MGSASVGVQPQVKGKQIKHYSSRHRILLVGEGDFSFAACLARAFGNASNMVATCLDSEEMLRRKHPTAAGNLDLLTRKGCVVIHNVDANTMRNHIELERSKFDRVVFNFPHAGYTLSAEHSSYQISLHKDVVQGFLKNAYEMLTEKGEIHITHKTAYPFSKWEIEKLAKKARLELADRADFNIRDYPGYENKRGDGDRSDSTFPIGECSTFMFAKYY